MINKRLSIMLTLMILVNLFTLFMSFDIQGASFAEDNPHYEYEPGDDMGGGFFFPDGTGKVTDTSGNVLFSDMTQGTVMVQQYYAGDIGWQGGNNKLWNRNNMFRKDRVREKAAVTAVRNTGYTNGKDNYYMNYVFYTQASWNGNQEQGGMARTARRIWGYYTATKSGTYKFRISTDDGHYMNFYEDDIFFDPKYDHYSKTTDYDAKWDRFYLEGINPIPHINDPKQYKNGSNQWVWGTNKDVEYGTMKVTSSVTSYLTIEMEEGEVYPFFIEYFNWGGGGKFYLDQSYNNGPYGHISVDALYPVVENIPREPADSGLDFDIVNGVRIVHGYDNFNGNSIDTDVWEYINNFSLKTESLENADGTIVSQGVLKSNGGLSSIKLKHNYQYYDSYEMTLDLVNISEQIDGLSNGGLTISHANDKWAYNTKMDYNPNTNNWDKVFDVNLYGSITNENKEGDTLESEVIFDYANNPTEEWQNKSIKMKILATRKDAKGTYNVITTLYNIDEYDENDSHAGKLSEITHEITSDELDFNKFYITAIEPLNSWVTYYDNFDFVAKRNLKFDSLEVDWDDNKYTLSWDLIPGVSKYTVKYQNGIDSSGNPKIYEYPVSVNDSLTIPGGKLFIQDDSWLCNRNYTVIADIDDDNDGKKDYEMTSNKVYVGGNVHKLALSGAYDGDDYIASWDDIDLEHKDKVTSYTYSLYYGDEGQITNPVDDAQNMTYAEAWNPTTNQLEFKFENLQKTSKYYGKQLQLIVDAVYSDTNTTRYYSNDVLMRAKLRLGVEHSNNHYILGWTSELGFDEYKLYRDSSESSFNNKATIPVLAHDTIQKTTVGDEIYVVYSDSNSQYTNKYYIIGGKVINNVEYSNIVRTYDDVTVPTLEWLAPSIFQWGDFSGATEVELYYGHNAKEINNRMDNPDEDTLSADNGVNQFISEKVEFKDKYVQAKFKKNDIWYYSNIVRTKDFNSLSAKIKNRGIDEDNAEIYDLTLSWNPIEWPEDTLEDDNGEISKKGYYQLYYIDENGLEQTIENRWEQETYTISDVFDSNSHYLDKKIHVRAVCPIVDKFGMNYTASLTSNFITPHKITFDSLKGVFNDASSTYTLDWQVPVVEKNNEKSDAVVTTYNIKFGQSKNTIDDKAIDVPLQAEVLTKQWDNVTESSDYYHKFYKIEAMINGVTYFSNTAYSGEKPNLKIDRFNDDFKLHWPLIEHADRIRIYYRDNEEGSEYKLYDQAELTGNATTYTLMDMLKNLDFNNKYYKIAAVFDEFDGYGGFEISSDELLVDTSRSLPVLDGSFDGKNEAYDINWNNVGWAESYKLYYEDVKSDDDMVDDSTFVEVDTNGQTFGPTDVTYRFANLLSNPNNQTYVRVRAIDGNFTAYSNAEYIEYPPFDGTREEPFDASEVQVQLSKQFDIVYNFNVYKEMKTPYFEIELNGSEYLVFDKETATLEKTVGSVTTNLPVRTATRLNEADGITRFLVYLNDDDKVFDGDDSISYKLTISSSIEVNRSKKTEVYEAFRSSNSTYENWQLPYYITKVDKDTDNSPLDLDEDMFIKYTAHWKNDDIDIDKQTSREMFDVKVIMKNKAELPSSY